MPPQSAFSPLALALAAGTCACAASEPATGPLPVAAPHEQAFAGPIRPLVAPTDLDPAAVALGRQLFHDPRLSATGEVSCATCHDLDAGGVDGLPGSVGVNGTVGVVNAPTVYNSGLNLAQFWDGRAATLEEQAGGPLLNPAEMGNSWAEILAYLGETPTYRQKFGEVYRDGVTEGNVRSAIASFERSLVTVDSPFDRWLQGDTTAIPGEAVEGYALFQSYGCASCHQGANVGGNMFQVLGVMRDYFAERGTGIEMDHGRSNATGRASDEHVFKVPSLRLASRTAPYLHDGSVATLEDAVDVMARYQLGREIPPADRARIVAFIGTLAGEPAAAGDAQ